MKKLLLIILCLVAEVAYSAAPAALWPAGDNLTSYSKIKGFIFNGVLMTSGADDPTITATDGLKGSTYQSTLTGKLYVKQDDGSTTNWMPTDAIPSHNDLLSIQGGAAGEYNHLDNADYAWVGLGFDGLDVKADGTIEAKTASYENLITTDNVLTSKKYVDDKMANAIQASQSSAILSGCALNVSSIGTATAQLDACKVRIVDSYTDPLNPEVTILDIPAQGIPVPNIATQDVSVLTVDKTGTFSFTAVSAPTSVDMRDNVALGSVVHPDRATISLLQNDSFAVGFDAAMALADHAEVYGRSVNYKGNVFTNPSGMTLDRTAGTVFGIGINQKAGDKSQNFKATASCTTCEWFYTYRDGASGWTNVPSQTSIVATLYDDGSGTLAAVPNNRFTIQRVYLAGEITIIQYGQQLYSTLQGAIDDAGKEEIEINPSIDQTTVLGWVIVKGSDVSIPAEQIRTARPNTVGASGGTVTYNVYSALEVTDAGNPNLITTCNNLVLADASAGAVTVTIPDSVASNANCVNKFYLYNNTNPVTVTTQGGTQLIGNATSQIISTEAEGFETFSYPTGNRYLIIQDSRKAVAVAYVDSAISNTAGAIPTYKGDGTKDVQESTWTLIGNALNSATETVLNFGKNLDVTGWIKSVIFKGNYKEKVGTTYGKDITCSAGMTCTPTDDKMAISGVTGDSFETALGAIDYDTPYITFKFDEEVTGTWSCQIRDSLDNNMTEVFTVNGTSKEIGRAGFYNNAAIKQYKMYCEIASATGTWDIEESWYDVSREGQFVLNQDAEHGRFYEAVSRGSTANKSFYFQTEDSSSNYGSTVKVVNNSVDGIYIEVLKPCKLDVAVAYSLTTSNRIGLSLNADKVGELTTAYYSLSDNVALTANSVVSTGYVASTSVSIVANVGDIIRPHDDGSGSLRTDRPSNFSFTATPTLAGTGTAYMNEMPVNHFSFKASDAGVVADDTEKKINGNCVWDAGTHVSSLAGAWKCDFKKTFKTAPTCGADPSPSTAQLANSDCIAKGYAGYVAYKCLNTNMSTRQDIDASISCDVGEADHEKIPQNVIVTDTDICDGKEYRKPNAETCDIPATCEAKFYRCFKATGTFNADTTLFTLANSTMIGARGVWTQLGGDTITLPSAYDGLTYFEPRKSGDNYILKINTLVGESYRVIFEYTKD